MTKFPGTRFPGGKRPLIALMLALAGTVPAMAQDAGSDTRLRRLEAEVRDLKRQSGGDRTVAPQAVPAAPTTRVAGTPATTPVADLLSRMDAIETQIARLTAQNEESGNKLRLLEERVAASEAKTAPAVPASAPNAVSAGPAVAAASATVTSPPATTSASSSNLAAMNGTAARGVNTPAAGSASATATSATAAANAARAPARATASRAAAPSAQRVAAVRAIVKPQTTDAGEDEYTYGFRLWEAKFYPEAEQQLKLFLDKYPRHARVTYARNLMGRALLSENKPREAASWFLQNYQANKQADRAPDSLLFLAESMSQLKDSSRACIALAEFSDTYPQEAAGRLKSQFDATRGSVKCN
jgi:TolA-binding protein